MGKMNHNEIIWALEGVRVPRSAIKTKTGASLAIVSCSALSSQKTAPPRLVKFVLIVLI